MWTLAEQLKRLLLHALSAREIGIKECRCQFRRPKIFIILLCNRKEKDECGKNLSWMGDSPCLVVAWASHYSGELCRFTFLELTRSNRASIKLIGGKLLKKKKERAHLSCHMPALLEQCERTQKYVRRTWGFLGALTIPNAWHAYLSCQPSYCFARQPKNASLNVM